MKWLSELSNVSKAVTAFIAAMIAIFGVYFSLNSTYTPIERTIQLEKRMTLKELKDLLRRVKEDYYYYKKLLREYPDDEEIKKKVEELAKEIKNLEEQIKELEKEQREG